jgi:hypothetical protein
MLGKMQRSGYTNGRNDEIKAWVEEHPDVKSRIGECIRNVPEGNREMRVHRRRADEGPEANDAPGWASPVAVQVPGGGCFGARRLSGTERQDSRAPAGQPTHANPFCFG